MAITRNEHATKELLVRAIEGLLAAWWAEFADFFGEDNEGLASFESQPAIIAARAAIELAKRERPQRALAKEE